MFDSMDETKVMQAFQSHSQLQQLWSCFKWQEVYRSKDIIDAAPQ